ncbi:ATP-dependent helicase/nuclease subunit B [Ligilactobacillus salitolerans]|uniref:ATP-dependent helicase/nuclease subunit B n=1 Tax=Ligilactobacillus salitolerans TaxID=1808352 RepID=A0A401IRE4_9LACO|nr:PD-(D/E)XK nuclease family protein [Ligilactobacillus salitolerans]GBG94103.1 ATP-dependent helicase/nuclease subunit B [Ligilactobacillus salitolerans]
MSLGFIYGKAGSDRKSLIFRQLERWQADKDVVEIFEIVPDHIKFESEVQVLDSLRQAQGSNEKMFASATVQTFSFSRLMWYFLKEKPALTKTRLTTTGLTMVVSHILHELEADDLYVFTRERNSPGFSKKLAEQLLELKLGGFVPTDIQGYADQLTEAPVGEAEDLGRRLHDLAIVYTKFEQYISGKYLDTADSLDALINYLEQVDLSHSCFMIEGFENFNAKEKEIIAVLIRRAKAVQISLVLDHKYVDQPPTADELFYQSGKIYYQFTQLAHAEQIPLQVDQIAYTPRVSPELLSLEQYWIDSQTLAPMGKYKLTDKEKISLAQTSDRVREVRYVAAKIRQLVFSGEYRYRDILILTPQQDKYANLLENLFSEYEIPVFTDLNKTMANHPLVEFVLALFDVKEQNFSYRSVMRLLKTELFVPNVEEEHWSLGTFRNTLDLLENCILQNGYFSSKDWASDQLWTVETCGMQPNETPEEHTRREQRLANNRYVNHLRALVYEQLEDFYQKIARVKTGREFAAALINFLDKIGVPQRLQGWQASAAKDLANDPERLTGSISDVSRHEEVWNTLCSLLDEYVTALGDEQVDIAEFISLIQTGFENAKYSQVPSTLDQVIFSESGVVQMENRRVLFFMGVNDTVMPRSYENNALLSDFDRDEFERLSKIDGEDKYLPETAAMQMAEEPFANYLSFMSISERIFFTYPVTDNDGQTLKLSPYIDRIKKAFNLQIKRADTLLDPKTEEIESLLGTARTALGELVTVSRDAFHDGQELNSVWRGLYSFLKNKLPQQTARLLSSLGFANEILPGYKTSEDGHKYLDPAIVEQLYGAKINTSISKLETFFADPYQYFLQYGLKLRPRQEYTLQPADTGEYFHQVMEYFFSNVMAKGVGLANLKPAEFDALLSLSFQQVETQLGGKVLSSTARYRYIKRQLNQTSRQVAAAIMRQRKQQQIYTVKTETNFGEQQGLPPLIYADNLQTTEHQMVLRGRIDRIDLVIGQDGKIYFNVVDYKSGDPERKMDHFLLRSFNGLSLQLLTYLRALQQAAENGQLKHLLQEKQLGDLNLPANYALELGSASYLHLFDPVIKATEKKRAEKLDKSFMYKGIFRRGEDNSEKQNGFLLALDQEIGSAIAGGQSGSSRNYPVKYVKGKKEFKSSSSKSLLLTWEQIRQLLEFNDLKIEEARSKIFAGMIDLAPYRLDNSSGLDYSDYQEIMMFDPLLEQNNYHKIDKLSEDQIWQEIQRELKERGSLR